MAPKIAEIADTIPGIKGEISDTIKITVVVEDNIIATIPNQ